MKSIYFTLCSNNYLSHAKTLGDSILKFNPEIKFVIGLVDEKDPSIDYSLFKEFDLLVYDQLGYTEFPDMLSRYNIIEFNTAVKPYYFEYLFRTNPEIESVYYIDPDILLYRSVKVFDLEWGDSNVLLTPNLIELPLTTSTGELASLRHGVNNLGFIGVRRTVESLRFIVWWKERLRLHCRIDKCFGIFVDQKWIDLAPLFFSGIKTVKHPGWNMAWWNLSERKLLQTETGYSVNSPDIRLVFFHFSGFKPDFHLMTERLKTEEFQMDSEGPLFNLFEEYKELILANRYEELSRKKPILKFFSPPNTAWIRIGRKVKSKLNNLIFRIFKV